MNIVVKNVVIPLNNWSFLQMMRINSHALRVVTGIPAGLCLRFQVDRPKEAGISAPVYQQPVQHPQEGFPEHLSPKCSRELRLSPMIECCSLSPTSWIYSIVWVSKGERKYNESVVVSSVYRFLGSASGLHPTQNGDLYLTERQLPVGQWKATECRDA